MRRSDDLRAHRVFGRDREIDEICRLLAAGPGIVTITGRGGVGKTSVALEVVRGLDAAEGSVWVPLAGVTDPDLVLAAIADALGSPIEAGADVAAVVAGVLGHGSRVLVLDNLEHLLGFVPTLADLLARCPDLRVLVTSQAPLRLRSERLVALSPLPDPADPADTTLEELGQQPAVATYCNQAAAVDWTFELTPQNASAIVELCRRLEGLPLAIELAAARAAMLPAGEILRRLDGTDGANLDLLRHQRSDAPDRHHSLRATIEWTYRLLPPGEQRALRVLSANVGTFDIDGAIALLDRGEDGQAGASDPLDALSSLVDLHLVDPVPGSDPARYSIPDSIRTFALEELERCGEADDVTRHRVRVRARQAREVALGSECCTTEGSLEEDRDDLVDALRAAVDLGLADEALDLVRGLGSYWDLRGYGPVQEQLMERALRLGEEVGADPGRFANAILWFAYLGLRHHSELSTDELVARIDEAEQMAVSSGDDQAAFHAQNVWLLVTPNTGDVARATAAAEEGLRLAERNQHDGWRAAIQVWAGMLAQFTGDEQRAVELGLAALEGGRRRGDSETIVRAFMLLGPMAERHPEQLSALPSLEEVIELTRKLGLTFYEVLLMLRRSHLALHDDPDGAVTWMAEALRKAPALLSSPLIGFYQFCMVHLAATRGDAERAAFFRGALGDSLAVIASYLPQTQSSLDAVDAAVRRELGDAAFEEQVRRGGRLTPGEAIDEAIHYVEELRPRAETGACPAPEAAPTGTNPPSHGAIRADRLTNRQMEVLQLLAKGLANKEIAAALGVREKTVMHHTTAIYRELGVRGRSEATAVALRYGLVG